jgi:hypothetical protein
VCTNPAALAAGGAASDATDLHPQFPTTDVGLLGNVANVAKSSGTAWATYPDLYAGYCETANGATWLQVNPAPNDPRPKVTQQLGPTWGLHLVDMNIAFDDLVALVKQESAAYRG